MPFIEAPTTFYMGRRYDPSTKRLVDEVVYYDSRDLTTHGVVVGMTGSGKTGLCISLLEEAVLDNIPAIVIDPKGDITNLLLTFPNLRPEDFAPWINVDDAQRAGLSLDEYARDISQQWRDGLSSWSIVPGRIAAMKNAAQFSIYTPGSDSGLPVSILDSLRPPPEGWVGFEEANRERISGIVTALLALIGKQAEPVKDREHVLLSNIFENAWRQGIALTLEDIILQVQKPPFSKLGVFDVDTFFPEKDRFKLAMGLNHVIAAPSFQSWITGEPLDISRLLYTQEGRPRVSIFYVAHLTEAERTFMITLLLENMLAWMRTLSGTTSLRCLLYFDEVFGHFPPAPRNPPTKEPLLRLLKQARAFGIGLVLATQNPGDLDYKGLSNAGTWWIGKLQTENDKNRVLGGLQAAATADSHLDMDNLNALLSSLDPRVFVLHNVHDSGGPILMHTRWSMSYLRGPLTRQQIRTLMEPQRRAVGLHTPAPGVLQNQTPSPTPVYDGGYISSPAPEPVSPPIPPSVALSEPMLQPIQETPLPNPPPAPPVVEPPSSVPEGTPASARVTESPATPGSTPPPPDLPEAGQSGSFRPSGVPSVTQTSPMRAPATPPPPTTPSQPAAGLGDVLSRRISDAASGNPPPQTPAPAAPEEYAPAAPPYPPLPEESRIYDASSFPVAPIQTGQGAAPTPTLSYSQLGSSQQQTSLTQRGAAIPEGYSDRPPVLPSTVSQFYLPALVTTQQAIREWEKTFNYEASAFGGAQLLYRPVLLAQLAVRYLDRKTNVEESQRWAFHVPNLEKSGIVPWGEYQATPIDPKQISSEPFGYAFYGPLSGGLTDAKRMTALKAEVIDYVYRSATLTIFYNSTLDVYASPRDSRRDFLLKIQQKAREARDEEIDVITRKYDKELERLDERLRRQLRDLTSDKQVLDELKREDLYTTGEAVLSLLKGRTTYTLSRMSRARRYKTQAQERAIQSEHTVSDIEQDIEAKQQELQEVLQGVNDKWAKVATTVEEVKLTPFKKDIVLEIMGIGWIPTWYVVLNGQPLMLPALAGSRTTTV
jgi:hypothetical protein